MFSGLLIFPSPFATSCLAGALDEAASAYMGACLQLDAPIRLSVGAVE